MCVCLPWWWTQENVPAFARYAAQTKPLCPPPTTTASRTRGRGGTAWARALGRYFPCSKVGGGVGVGGGDAVDDNSRVGRDGSRQRRTARATAALISSCAATAAAAAAAAASPAGASAVAALP